MSAPHESTHFSATRPPDPEPPDAPTPFEWPRTSPVIDIGDLAQPRALPRGTRIQRFEIVRVLAETSLDLVYLAIDHERQVEVAIKEYMPLRLARRIGEQVQAQTPADAATVARGLHAFVAEARLLAKAQHPSLARMIALIEANATAYQVMPRYIGKSLLQVRQEMDSAPDERALRAMFDALLGALEALHHQGQLHRAVAPAKIMLLADDRPLLLGPGSARDEVASGLVESLMAAVEPSFAAPEQQPPGNPDAVGPWTDLYSLAQTMRFCISGELPPPASAAPERARHERTAQTVRRLFGDPPTAHYSAALLGTLDAMLAPLPSGRPQSVDEIRRQLAAAPPVDLDDAHTVSAFSRTAPVPEAARATRIEPAFDLDIDLSRGPALTPPPAVQAAASKPVSRPAPEPSPPRIVVPPRRTLGRALWAGGTVAVLLGAALAAGWWLNDAVGVGFWPLHPVAQGPADPGAIAEAGPPSAGPLTAVPAAGPGAAAAPADAAASDAAAAPAPASMTARSETAAMRPAAEVTGTPPATTAAPAAVATPPSAALPASSGSMAPAPAAQHATGAPATQNPPATSTAADASGTTPAPAPSVTPTAPGSSAMQAAPESSATPAPRGAAVAADTAPAAPAATPPRASARTAAGRPVPARATRRTPPAAEAPTTTAASPRDACAGRSQFSLYRCMQVQCVQSMWIHHPQCARLRATDSVD